MNYEEIQRKICVMLSKKRYEHSLGVVKWAEILARTYDFDIEKAKIAAISHDCAKEYLNEELLSIARGSNLEIDEVTMAEPQLLHGPVGSVVAQKVLGIDDVEILRAIQYHTTGRSKMTLLEKIIYISDIIEEGRCYKGVEIVRDLVVKDIDQALILCIDNTINYVVSIKGLLHPKTIEARNDLILKQTEKNREVCNDGRNKNND